MRKNIIYIFIGIAVGNFLFMYFGDSGSLKVAMERTYFQFIALLGVFISTFLED